MELLLRSFIQKGQELKTAIECEPQTAEGRGVRHLLCLRLLVFGVVHVDCARLFAPYIQVEEMGLDVMPSIDSLVNDKFSFSLEEIELEEFDSDIDDV